MVYIINKINETIHSIWPKSAIKITEDILNKKPSYILTLSKNSRSRRFKEPLNKYRINIAQILFVPHNLSGKNLCPNAGICEKICFAYPGNPGRNQFISQLNRTLWYHDDFSGFLTKLIEEIINFINYCKRNNYYPVLRLNGYSDIRWEEKKFKCKDIKEVLEKKNYNLGQYRYKIDNRKIKSNEINNVETYLQKRINLSLERNKNRKFTDDDELTIFDLFYDILFYDYTKIPRNPNQIPSNYHLTYSYDKENAKKSNFVLPKNLNISVIVTKDLKKILLKEYPNILIDGDAQDCRILDDINNPSKKKVILLEYQKQNFHEPKVEEVAFIEKEKFIEKFKNFLN